MFCTTSSLDVAGDFVLAVGFPGCVGLVDAGSNHFSAWGGVVSSDVTQKYPYISKNA